MKKKIIAILVSLIVIILDIIFIFDGDIIFSDMENRYLMQLPKFSFENFLDGRYMDNLTDYLKDQFPYRNIFVGLKTETEKILLKSEISGVYLAKDNYLIETYNEIEDKDKLVRIFNNFKQNVNIDLKLLLVPTAISFYQNKLPMFSIYDNQMDDINYIYNNIEFNFVNVYDTFMSNSEDVDLYYKTDHHWTIDGAYYAYLEIANSFGLSRNTLTTKKVSDKFYGTLYSKVNDYTRKPDDIYIYLNNYNLDVYYDDIDKHTNSLYEFSYLDKKDKYALFLDNNHSLIVITNNDIENDDELIIIKDSYANSLIPFLVNHYKKIHVIDPRYYNKKISEYIGNNNNITHGIILYNIGTIEDDLGVYTIR